MGKDRLPKAMLLDMDDTILALSDGAALCWQSLCVEYAQRLGQVAAEALFEAIDRSRQTFWSDRERARMGRLDLIAARRAIVAAAFDELRLDQLDLAYQMADRFAIDRQAALRPFPGAIETVEWLRSRGVRLALLTNGAAVDQRAKIERFDLARHFDCVLIEGEFGVGKPDERVYRHALQQLGAEAHESWMVGDNLEWEVEIPQKLGIYAIWVDVAGAGLPPDSPIRPDRIIRTLSELRE